MGRSFGCIVIGAGHAGVEAALASARMGVTTLMVNYSMATVGLMSCNPAIGGIGKGQLVREVDILGGAMGLAADLTAIQFRQLNASKGQAVRSSRVQSDRVRYCAYMQGVVKAQPGLEFYEGEAVEILVGHGRVIGLRLKDGGIIEAPTVVVTAGTFLDGRCHLGPRITSGGRIGDASAIDLARSLEALGFTLRSFKTGTPPRLDGRTIDYSCLQAQHSDDDIVPFSFRTKEISSRDRLLPCWFTHTNDTTHQIIRDNFHLSPMYSGQIAATGVRYCPSIEDKLKKFADKTSHPVFLEPDGLGTPVVYPNGLSTGLPEAVQEAFVHTIPGLERAAFLCYGYSIEHGVIYAEELKATLESRRIAGLFFAGQVNGTTGYEEAAAQGIVAGINAALHVRGEEPFILRRDEAYTGVLIDDLITRGTEEPYRMFTSRVEYRLIVREDNTDERLVPYGRKFGLVSDDVCRAVEAKYAHARQTAQHLRETSALPAEMNPVLEALGQTPLAQKISFHDVLKRPGITCAQIIPFDTELSTIPKDILARVEYDIKYEGFIIQQQKEVEKFRYLENIRIPAGFDFAAIKSLSHEAREKLVRFKPATLGQANRISGITPVSVSILMIYLKKYFAEQRP